MSVGTYNLLLLYYGADKKSDLPQETKGVPSLDPEESNNSKANEEMTPIVVTEDPRKVRLSNTEELHGLSEKDDMMEPISASTVSNSVIPVSGLTSKTILSPTQETPKTPRGCIVVPPITSVPVDEFNLQHEYFVKPCKSLTNSYTSSPVVSVSA